jgi:GH24 family phage-related lysozyme (muramidase)
MISQRAIDFIVACEVSSRAYYEKHYRKPEWPGGSSGVTVGIGYDLGYTDIAKLRADWTGVIPDEMISAMSRVIGLKGKNARDAMSLLNGRVDISWDAAMKVFLQRDIPKFTQEVCQEVPGSSTLSSDCLGALVSLAYNRGSKCFTADGDRYKECRAIRSHISDGYLSKVPGDFREMKRLWINTDVSGLVERREKEAQLFESGLSRTATRQNNSQHIANETPAPITEPPSKAATHGPPAGAVIATAAATKQAASSGYSLTKIAIIIAIGVVIAVALYFGFKKSVILARRKDIA